MFLTVMGVKMKIIMILFMLGISTTAHAADKKVEVQFSYDNRPVTEFRLYMDGTKICSSTDGQARTMDCPAVAIPYGVHLFTMTAVEPPGVETSHSPAYMWTYSPAQGSGPVFINFSITVDGKVIPVGPANQ